jgi:hypothetical protein
MIINLQRLSLRLTGLSKRLFFLQVQGFLQKKILLRSEYGIVIGETVFADKSSQAPVLFNGQKFFYQVEDGKLTLLDSEKNFVCESELAQPAALNRFEFYSLLFGLAWFSTTDAVADKKRVLPVTA